MSKTKRTKRIDWKRTLIVLLVAVGICAGAVGIFAATSRDTEKIGAGAFSIGGLNDQGEYVEQKNTIFTDELIECQGLEITPDFKSTVEYKVFLYSTDKELIEVTDKLSGNYKLNNAMAQYCRIMIIPEGSAKKDFEIGMFEVRSYAKQLTITVNREQNFSLKDYFVADEAKEGKVASSASATLTYVAKEGYGVSKLIDCSTMEAITVKYVGNVQADAVEVLFYTASESGDTVTYNFVSAETVSGEAVATKVAVPEAATHIVVNYRLGEQFVINQAIAD